jgi:Trypsin
LNSFQNKFVVHLECFEYKKLLIKNETIDSFILGEKPTITRVETCHQNKEDIGIASEMEFPYIALIKLQENHETRRFYNVELKCVGSLISERHVITSFYCVNSLIKFKVTVHLGVFNYDLSDSNLQSHEVESLDTKYGVTILRLQNQVIFSDHIMPACLFPEKVATSEVLLAGWTGDWQECESRLKKWHIRNNEVTYISRWQITIDQSAIMNYRQVSF